MKVVTRDIGHGDDAIFTTLQHMKRLARRDARTPDVGVVASRIRTDCKKMYAHDEALYQTMLIKAAFTWVVDHITYKFDHEAVTTYKDVANPKSVEFLIAPRHLITIGEGDCDDMSTMLASILLALKIPVKFKIIAHKTRSYSHVYCEAYIEAINRWIPVDPVMGRDGWANEKGDVIRKNTYNV